MKMPLEQDFKDFRIPPRTLLGSHVFGEIESKIPRPSRSK